MPNTELLNRTLNYIEAHPDRWDQSVWALRMDCGTAHCFAGWAVALGCPDAVMDFEKNDDVTCWVAVTGGYQRIDELAAELLELSENQANNLFDAANSMAALRRLVAELTAGEPALDAVAGR